MRSISKSSLRNRTKSSKDLATGPSLNPSTVWRNGLSECQVSVKKPSLRMGNSPRYAKLEKKSGLKICNLKFVSRIVISLCRRGQERGTTVSVCRICKTKCRYESLPSCKSHGVGVLVKTAKLWLQKSTVRVWSPTQYSLESMTVIPNALPIQQKHYPNMCTNSVSVETVTEVKHSVICHQHSAHFQQSSVTTPTCIYDLSELPLHVISSLLCFIDS